MGNMVMCWPDRRKPAASNPAASNPFSEPGRELMAFVAFRKRLRISMDFTPPYGSAVHGQKGIKGRRVVLTFFFLTLVQGNGPGRVFLIGSI